MNRGYLAEPDELQNSRITLAKLMGYEASEEPISEQKIPNQVSFAISVFIFF